MKFREIANGASGRQFDRESKYPLPVALMVIGTRKNWDQEKGPSPDTPPKFKLMCPFPEPLPTAFHSSGVGRGGFT